MRLAATPKRYRLGETLFVPARGEDQAVVPYGPRVLGLLLAGLGVQENVVDPAALFVGGEQVVTVEVPGDVDTQARIAAPELGVVVANGEAVLDVDDEDVSGPVDALDHVVVGNGHATSFGVISAERAGHERLRVAGGVRLAGAAFVPA